MARRPARHSSVGTTRAGVADGCRASVRAMPTTAQLREAMERYATVISSRDADAYAALFTPDAVQVDPVPTPPNVGRDAIRAFIQRSFDSCETMPSRWRRSTRWRTRRPSPSTSR